jgi:hypothetical protein
MSLHSSQESLDLAPEPPDLGSERRRWDNTTANPTPLAWDAAINGGIADLRAAKVLIEREY